MRVFWLAVEQAQFLFCHKWALKIHWLPVKFWSFALNKKWRSTVKEQGCQVGVPSAIPSLCTQRSPLCLLPCSGIAGGWQPHCLTVPAVMEGNCLLKWLALKWSGTSRSTQRWFRAEKELRHIPRVSRSWPISCDRLIHSPFTTEM